MSQRDDEYDPHKVAQAFLAHLFCWPEAMAVLLDYWRTQFSALPPPPLSTQLLLGMGSEDDDEDEDTVVAEYEDAVLQGLAFFAGQGPLLDVQARMQQNAMPQKTDTGTRHFVCLWFVFAGGRTLAMDDVFLAFQAHKHWTTPALRDGAKTLATCLGHMSRRHDDFWEHHESHGMAGHLILTHFKGAQELGERLYRPIAFCVAHVERFFEWRVRHGIVRQEQEMIMDDAAVDAMDCLIQKQAAHLAIRMVRVETEEEEEPLWSFAWHHEVDAGDHDIMTQLYTILNVCRTPEQVPQLWLALHEFVRVHVRSAGKAMFHACKQETRGGHLVPGHLLEDPRQYVPVEEILSRL